MILPGRLTIFALAIGAVAAIAAGAYPLLAVLVLLLDAIIMLLLAVEGAGLRRAEPLVRMQFPRRGEMGQTLILPFEVTNRAGRPMHVGIENFWPAGFRCTPSYKALVIPAGGALRYEFVGTAQSRGLLEFSAPVVSYAFALPWAKRRYTAPLPEPIRIYPDLTPVRQYETLRRHRALGLSGFHRRRLLGSGREFEQLRDYLPDDDFRDINWRASAHHQRLISNIYQVERRQDVLICVDNSRLMATPLGDRTTLDYAIGAAILLAHVAGVERDHIGLLVFREIVERFVRPAGGTTAENRLVEKLVEIRSQPVFPSFAGLVAAIRARQNRRGMVFIFTDLNDPQLLENLRLSVPAIAQRHLVTVFSLLDPLLFKLANAPAISADGVMQVLAARHLTEERENSKVSLSRAGVLLIESQADQLNLQVINHYLNIRTRQLV